MTEGKIYTVTGTKNFLALRNDFHYNDANIIGKYHNGYKLRVIGRPVNGYVLIEDPADGRMGFVDAKYLK